MDARGISDHDDDFDMTPLTYLSADVTHIFAQLPIRGSQVFKTTEGHCPRLRSCCLSLAGPEISRADKK